MRCGDGEEIEWTGMGKESTMWTTERSVEGSQVQCGGVEWSAMQCGEICCSTVQCGPAQLIRELQQQCRKDMLH